MCFKSCFLITDCVFVLRNKSNCLNEAANFWKYIFIWVKLSWTDIFSKSCHFFFNFNSCFWALLALSHLLRLIFLVNHVGRGRQNWFLDLPPHVRYLKTTSKHGWFGGFHPLFLLLYYFSMLPNQAKTFKNLSIVFVLCMETLFSFVSLSFYHL